MMKLPQYTRRYIKSDLTEPLTDLPSVVVGEAKEKTDTVAMCYLLPKSTSDIRYFLEFDAGFYDDGEPWMDYGVLALYTFKNNHRILADLTNDVYTQDVKKYDDLVKSVGITEQVEKEKLVKFCDDYWYSNGYNSKERFERVLDDNYEGGLITEVVDKVTNIYDKLLGNY